MLYSMGIFMSHILSSTHLLMGRHCLTHAGNLITLMIYSMDIVLFLLIHTIKKAEFKLSGEVKEAKWFTLDKAEETLFEGSYGKDMIRFMKSRKKEN